MAIEQGVPWVETDINLPGGGGPSQAVTSGNLKAAMAEEYERQQAIIEAERAARRAEARRLESLPFAELTPAQCIIVHGSDYPLCPGATPVADLFPEHGDGVPALYSDPDITTPQQWAETVEEIIITSEPLPTPEIVEPTNGQTNGLMSAIGGTPGEGAGMGLATLAILLL